MKQNIATFSNWIIVLVGIPALMYLGRPFLVTFFIAIILAMVLSPVMDWLIKKGLGRGWAVLVCTLIVVLFFAILAGLLTYQISLVAKDLPRMEQKANDLLNQAQSFIQDKTGMAPEKQMDEVKQQVAKLGSLGMSFFGSFTNTVTNFFLMFVYLVLLLSHRHKIQKFLISCVEPSDKQQAYKLIFKARDTASMYIWGMLKDVTAMAIVYAIGFMIGGIKHGIFLAIIAAVFSFLPYIGNIIGGGTAAVLAMISGEPSAFLIVVGVMTVAQIIENYTLSPFLVGNAVGLNPFFSIVSIIVISMIWGIGGAIIALPLTGVIRVALLFSPHTKPMAEFMGDDDAS
ncbi:AI-2E family transporter [Salmonirosea aquatica]|uniref:AI-2E family transporter n=1 Tax=Salmonirosea aquatica TaxID=2654236 RepID=A0A7C9BMP1_9BACT|nr:AI-2E family transporter [Cytophagaceae bacterium SJW1-29]